MLVMGVLVRGRGVSEGVMKREGGVSGEGITVIGIVGGY